MNIRTAVFDDLAAVHVYDKHIAKDELGRLIAQNRVLIAEDDHGTFCGWLRYNLFWDNTPFMNMLYILEPYRGKGYGQGLVECWEKQMQGLSYDRVMTSTASDEYAQHFYVRLGYQVVGGFMPVGEPYELILAKRL